MSAPSVHHPLFARFYTHVLARNEPAEMRAYRDELLAGVNGRVVEVGAGSGANFPHYPAEVTEVVAVEPESYLREQAVVAASRASMRVTVLDGIADALPLEDASCDAAVACLVLCTVPDQASALAELRRVLKPGGRLIASVDHPFAIVGLQRQEGQKVDYFETYNWTEDWTMGGHTVPMSFWNRPLHAMTDAFTAAGFRISVISEPDPVPEARELFPDMLAEKPRFLCFLFFVLHAG